MRHPVAILALSAAALVGIASFEGFRDTAYNDGVGIQTIGYGTTSGVRPGDKITPERALVRLFQESDRYAQAVRRCAPVPMYQHEFDAYVSLTYNIGPGAFCASTLARKLNARQYAPACKEILRWNKAGGKTLAGLVKRREAEYRSCLGEEA